MSIINVTQSGEYKLPASDVSCREFRNICTDALQWSQAIMAKKDPLIIKQAPLLVDYTLFHLWCVEYGVTKGDSIWHDYHDACAVAHFDLIMTFCDDSELTQAFFYNWFVSEAYHLQEPFAREELMQQALARQEWWDQTFLSLFVERSDWRALRLPFWKNLLQARSQGKGEA